MIFVGLTGVTRADCLQRQDHHSFTPPQGIVPDERTAVRVADAVLIPIFGEAQVAQERPLHATSRGDIWIVTGSLPELPPGQGIAGGVAEVKIDKCDGSIVSVLHGQ
ncbi:MAG: hypothetical protein JO128_00885 [Alphaproteobacteria bacterium]|nr:hypothetical protein [Alphaproteobacteria bacterium]